MTSWLAVCPECRFMGDTTCPDPELTCGLCRYKGPVDRFNPTEDEWEQIFPGTRAVCDLLAKEMAKQLASTIASLTEVLA